MISTMTNGETQIAPEYEPRLAESEYSPDEPHTFAALAKRNEAVAKLSGHAGRPTPPERQIQQRLAAVGPQSGMSRHVPHRRSVLGWRWHGPRRQRLHRSRDRVPCCRGACDRGGNQGGGALRGIARLDLAVVRRS